MLYGAYLHLLSFWLLWWKQQTSCDFAYYCIVCKAGELEKAFFLKHSYFWYIFPRLAQYVLNITDSILRGWSLWFSNIQLSNLLKTLLCSPVLFFLPLAFFDVFLSGSTYWSWRLPGTDSGRAAWRCLRGNHLGPRRPPCSPYHMWSTDLLCSSSSGTCDSVSCCHTPSHKVTNWKGAKDSRHLPWKKKKRKKKSDFSIIHWKCFCGSIFFSFWDAGNSFNRQCIICSLEERPYVPRVKQPVITESYR